MHLPTVNAKNTYAKIQTKSMQTNKDGNSVDVTTEMLDLMKANQLYGISLMQLIHNMQLTKQLADVNSRRRDNDVSGN